MNKLFFHFGLIPKMAMFSIWSACVLLYPPQVSALTQLQHYSNCAELQKRLNDKNPEDRFQGFEKAKMEYYRSMPFQSVYASTYFCDGGIHTQTYKDGIKRMCSGYIMRYISPYSNDQGLTEKFYAGPGEYRESRSDIDVRIKRYCRQVS